MHLSDLEEEENGYLIDLFNYRSSLDRKLVFLHLNNDFLAYYFMITQS